MSSLAEEVGLIEDPWVECVPLYIDDTYEGLYLKVDFETVIHRGQSTASQGKATQNRSLFGLFSSTR